MLLTESNHIESMVLSANTGDRSTLQFLMAQNNRCLTEHAECQRRPSDFTPTRLIDVGGEEDSMVHLCDRIEVAQESRYAVLSHCWGKHLPLTLSTTNCKSFKGGIQVASLPKTFQDAIKVVRTFGHRYLWIDSLYEGNALHSSFSSC